MQTTYISWMRWITIPKDSQKFTEYCELSWCQLSVQWRHRRMWQHPQPSVVTQFYHDRSSLTPISKHWSRSSLIQLRAFRLFDANAFLISIEHFRAIGSSNLTKIQQFSSIKMILKVSPAILQPPCRGLGVLIFNHSVIPIWICCMQFCRNPIQFH